MSFILKPQRHKGTKAQRKVLLKPLCLCAFVVKRFFFQAARC